MAQPFPDMLEMLDGGDASAELTSTFDAIKEEMLERVRATGSTAKASMTLKLSLECDAKGRLTIAYDVDTKRPKAVRAESTYWIGDDLKLALQPPRNTPIEKFAAGERGDSVTTNTSPRKAKEV